MQKMSDGKSVRQDQGDNRFVAGTLTGIARKKGFRQIRISGNEPTLGREHLIKVLELVPKDILFIL